MGEFVSGFQAALSEMPKAITIFGSARTKAKHIPTTRPPRRSANARCSAASR